MIEAVYAFITSISEQGSVINRGFSSALAERNVLFTETGTTPVQEVWPHGEQVSGQLSSSDR